MGLGSPFVRVWNPNKPESDHDHPPPAADVHALGKRTLRNIALRSASGLPTPNAATPLHTPRPGTPAFDLALTGFDDAEIDRLIEHAVVTELDPSLTSTEQV